MAKNLFSQEIAAFKKLFDARLRRFLARKQKEAGKVGKEYAALVRYLAKYTLAGGKRLRPWLLCRGRRIAGGKSSVKANQAGLALELFHNFALIHDDIMDGADLRRGQPALHQQLTQWHRQRKWRGDSQEFGIGMAILGGDMMLTWADELINSLGLESVSSLYHEMKSELMIGQAEDVFLSKIKEIPARSRIINTALLKSARYSVEKPLLLGAAVAGREKQYRPLFRALAKPLGLAFQLRDDVLGMFGEKSTSGKSVGGDIREGKMTLLMYYALKSGQIPKKILREVWGDEKASDNGIARIRTGVKNSQALEKVLQDIAKQLIQAEKIINESKLMKSKEKALFLNLINFFRERNY